MMHVKPSLLTRLCSLCSAQPSFFVYKSSAAVRQRRDSILASEHGRTQAGTLPLSTGAIILTKSSVVFSWKTSSVSCTRCGEIQVKLEVCAIGTPDACLNLEQREPVANVLLLT